MCGYYVCIKKDMYAYVNIHSFTYKDSQHIQICWPDHLFLEDSLAVLAQEWMAQTLVLKQELSCSCDKHWHSLLSWPAVRTVAVARLYTRGMGWFMPLHCLQHCRTPAWGPNATNWGLNATNVTFGLIATYLWAMLPPCCLMLGTKLSLLHALGCKV